MRRQLSYSGGFRSVVLTLTALLVYGGVSAQTIVSVEPSLKTVGTPAAFTLDVTVHDVTELHAVSVTVVFDPFILNLSRVTLGPFLTGAWMPTPRTTHGPVYDSLHVDQAILGPAWVSGTGVILILTFEPLHAGTTPIGLPAPLLFGHVGETCIAATGVDGQVIVENTLSVTLSSFSAHPLPTGSGVRLEWATLSEIENYGFWIDRRSEADQIFSRVPGSFVAGNGTTLLPHTYSFEDCTIPGPGRYQYRLRQLSQDGSEHFYEGVWIEVVVTHIALSRVHTFMLSQNYPNPFNPTTLITFSPGSGTRATLVVLNILGEEIARIFEGPVEPGRYYTVAFDGNGFPSGHYVYRLVSGGKTEVRQMALVR